MSLQDNNSFINNRNVQLVYISLKVVLSPCFVRSEADCSYIKLLAMFYNYPFRS
jgi:hypothetical protein